jgi:hypothetical protein
MQQNPKSVIIKLSLDEFVEVLEKTKVSAQKDFGATTISIGVHPELGQITLLNSIEQDNAIVVELANVP